MTKSRFVTGGNRPSIAVKQTPQAARAALKPIELAARWGNSRQHIYDLMREGQLKSFRSGRHHRIPITEIERFERGESS